MEATLCETNHLILPPCYFKHGGKIKLNRTDQNRQHLGRFVETQQVKSADSCTVYFILSAIFQK